ncbi:MAG: nucleoside hydrolase, partial [Paenibacillus sp.]|nr:nucleoside hydrolase [Paenibacillus sp.]
MQSIILDTDIGTDFDDAAALALAMKADGLQLTGVTTVYGDTALRARLAKKLLRLGGREEVPVFAGCEQTLSGSRKIAWAGHEGEGVLGDGEETFDDGDAVQFIIRTVMEHPGQTTLVTIGPL